MSETHESASPFKDAHVAKKVREAMHDPLTLAELAAAIDPQAIREGNMQESLERAQMLLWQAGLRAALIRRDHHAEKGIVPIRTMADYEREADLLNKGWVVVEPSEVLVLSEEKSRDTLRPYLREHCNFEGKNAKGKRGGWKTVRSVMDDLQLWFFDRAEAYNRSRRVRETIRTPSGDELISAFQELQRTDEISKEEDIQKPWEPEVRDKCQRHAVAQREKRFLKVGAKEFENAKTEWVRTIEVVTEGKTTKQNEWHIPKAEIVSFIAWRRQMRGKMDVLRERMRAATQKARRGVENRGEKKDTDLSGKISRESAESRVKLTRNAKK